MTAALDFDHVSLRYGERVAVADVSLSIEHGELLSLLGPSGCGKSSLFRLALGLVAPTSGEIWIDGERVSQRGRILIPPERRNLSAVFQDLALWPHLSVEEHLCFVLAARGVPRSERPELIDAMLIRLGLLDRRGSYPAELSGGQQQRVAIARALVTQPRAVLLDEPLSNIDLVLKRELLPVIRHLLDDAGATAIYVSHDIREVAYLGGTIAVMEAGCILAVGTLDTLRRSTLGTVAALLEGLSWTGQTREGAE